MTVRAKAYVLRDGLMLSHFEEIRVYLITSSLGELVMELRHTAMTLMLGSFLIVGTQTAYTMTVFIKEKPAKKLYNSLTGPTVQQDGAAGHSYRKGNSVLCRYTDVDITQHGKLIPPEDPFRYACSITFNPNGQASPGPNP